MGIETSILVGASMIATIASTAMSVYSSIQQAGAQAQMNDYNSAVARNNAIAANNAAKYNASIMNNNAIAAEQDAKRSREEAAENERRKRLENSKIKAQQQAAYAKSGVIMEGSPLAVLGETAQNLEIEALDIRREGEIAAQEHLRRAQNYRSQSALDLYSGEVGIYKGNSQAYGFNLASDAARRGGYAKATTSLLSGISKTASMASSAYKG